MSRSAARVLVVDEAGAARRTADRIEAALPNVRVLTAHTISAALSVLEGQQVDCVVSDYEVPVDSGALRQGVEQLVRRVREADDSLPVVLFSTASSQDIDREAVADGVDGYVLRHEDSAYDRLTGRIAEVIRERRSERQADTVGTLTTAVRLLHKRVIRAETLEAVDRSVVESLVETGLYRSAAIGDIVSGQFTPRATAGEEPADSFTWRLLPDPRGEFAVIAGSPTTADTLAPVIGAVPLVHDDDDRYGVLALTATREDVFGETERDLLTDLAETVAYAIRAVQTRERLHRREQDLEHKNERLEQFASAVSHDIRNPLQVATSNLELLAEEVDNDRVDTIDESLERVSELVEDVLAMASEDDRRLDTEPVSLDSVVRDAWREVATGSGTLDIDPRLGRVVADRSQLRRLLANLLRNAVEHGSTDPDSQARQDTVEHDSVLPVSIRVRWLEDHDGFAVDDDGPGIPPEKRDDLFELGHTSDTGNTGLGLAIVDEIADAHGWSVSVEDSPLGGASFEVTGMTVTED